MRKIYEKRFQWKFFKTQIICNVKNSCINNSWLNIKNKYKELDQNFTQKLLQDPFSKETSSFNIIVLGIRQKKDVSSWFRLWKRGTWWFHQTQVGLHLKDDVCVKKNNFYFPPQIPTVLILSFESIYCQTRARQCKRKFSEIPTIRAIRRAFYFSFRSKTSSDLYGFIYITQMRIVPR